MIRFFITSAILFCAFAPARAGAYDTLRPRFNYSLLKELKDVGERNVLNLKIGPWTEYFADSSSWKESVDVRDFGRNLYPPHKIILVKCVGEYVDGKKNGLWKYYRTFSTKQPVIWELMETWTFKLGQPDGPQRAYYDSGELMHEHNYKNGKLNGTYRSYTRKGQVTVATTYVDGKAEGKTEHFALNGVLIWSCELSEGLYHGMVQEFYYNGQLRSKIEFKNGKPWNAIDAFTRYGAAMDKGTLKNGTGVYYTFDEGGSKLASAELLNGMLHGTSRSYFYNGNVETECEFRNDTMSGIYRDFYPEGGILHLKSVVAGMVDGPVVSYYKNGRLKCENIYKKGKLWATVYANSPEGKKINCGNVKMGSGTIYSYDDTGRVELKQNYSFGFVEGTCEQIYPNGKIASTVNYLLDLPHGECRNYNEEGMLVAIITYTEGMLDGPAKTFHENGKIYEEAYYYRGRLWEMISIHDSSGRKLNTGTFKHGSGKLNAYYSGGAIYSVKEMKHGACHGTSLAYYEDGKKYGEYHYFQDSLVGSQKEFWPNGQIAAERITNEYAKDEKVIQYHSNGLLWTVWEYEEGLLWKVDSNLDTKGSPHDKGTFSKGTGSLLRYDEKDSVIYEYQFINGRCLNCDDDRNTLLNEN